MNLKKIVGMLLLMLLPLCVNSAEGTLGKNETLDGQIQNLKREVLKLNRNLFLLQEELLFPGNSQFSVFLSLDIGQYFTLDSVTLKMDDKMVASHLYTQHERQALKRGAVQQLYLGNIKSGQHEIVALFTGIGPDGRESQRAASLNFEKGVDPKFIELKIIDQTSNGRATFEVKEWQ